MKRDRDTFNLYLDINERYRFWYEYYFMQFIKRTIMELVTKGDYFSFPGKCCMMQEKYVAAKGGCQDDQRV